jgi:hypothetical protein
MSSQPRIIIVVLVVGEAYTKTFQSFFLNNLVNYCNIHHYELDVLDKVIKPPAEGEPPMNKRQFFWQRMLIPSKYRDYDYVITMDSDIYVSLNAPALPLAEIPRGKVGAVNERKYFQNYEWREQLQVKFGWERTGRDWHARSGLDRPYNDHINAGLIIYQPAYHADALVALYNDNIDNYMIFHQDDQSILSVFFIDNDLIHWIDERYNRIWMFWRHLFYPNFDDLDEDTKRLYVARFTELNYFTHFCSGLDIDCLPTAPRRSTDSDGDTPILNVP